jgi:hypothetical protein
VVDLRKCRLGLDISRHNSSYTTAERQRPAVSFLE